MVEKRRERYRRETQANAMINDATKVVWGGKVWGGSEQAEDGQGGGLQCRAKGCLNQDNDSTQGG